MNEPRAPLPDGWLAMECVHCGASAVVIEARATLLQTSPHASDCKGCRPRSRRIAYKPRDESAELFNLSLSTPHQCGRCGSTLDETDMGRIGDGWYCHPSTSNGPTCYMRQSWAASVSGGTK